MIDSRTVIVGMNNPLSDDPRHALAPYPVNCTGWRVWRMLDDAATAQRCSPTGGALPGQAVGRKGYMAAYERRNVLHAQTWSRTEARRAGGALLAGLGNRRLIVLGVQTLAALQLERASWCEWRPYGGLLDTLEYCLLPHPSGLCREYNDATLRASAGCVLLNEYRRFTETIA